MTALVANVSAWVIACVLAGAMLASWAVGWRQGRRAALLGRPVTESKFGDAILALLGLLLAFSFSLALSKHDQQRQAAAVESSAMGDFYTCASLLTPEQGSAELMQVIRDYAGVRLTLARRTTDEQAFEEHLAESERLHTRMTTLVRRALETPTPIAVPLVNTLNALTSSHTMEVSVMRDRLPASIVGVLFAAAVAATWLIGIELGASGERQLAFMIGFVALVGMVVWVTLDLNQPRRGFITISQDPMRRVLGTMTE